MADCSDPAIQAQITAAANKYGVPPAIALGVAQQESNCRQSARNSNANGTVDIGMFQLNSATFPNANPNDVAGNIDYGVGYLAQMYAKFGNWPQAIAAYNGGPGYQSTGNPNPPKYSASVLKRAASFGYDAGGSASVPVPDASGGTYVAADDTASPASGFDFSQISPAAWAGAAAVAGLALWAVAG